MHSPEQCAFQWSPAILLSLGGQLYALRLVASGAPLLLVIVSGAHPLGRQWYAFLWLPAVRIPLVASNALVVRILLVPGVCISVVASGSPSLLVSGALPLGRRLCTIHIPMVASGTPPL
jgi:hypothetical protein